MSEFVNRMSAQRAVLEAVNARAWAEPLLGISSAALARWMGANRLGSHDELVRHLHAVSDKLLFLANRSQEQISEEYASVSAEVTAMTARIPSLVNVLLASSAG